MKKIIAYFLENEGYARFTELRKQGFQSSDITKLYKAGILEKLQPGLYKLANSEVTSSLVDASKGIPKGVITLISALAYYGLTTFNPSRVHVAIPNKLKPPVMFFPAIQFHYFRHNVYFSGIKNIYIQGHHVKIYNKEKTICDMFRYRNQLGEDIAFEALKAYIKQPASNLYELHTYMKISRVKTVMEPYLKALVAQ